MYQKSAHIKYQATISENKQNQFRMQKFYFLLFLVCIQLSSCKNENEVAINLHVEINEELGNDSIYIRDLITRKEITRISTNSETDLNLEYPTVGIIYSDETDQGYLTTLTPEKKFIISAKPDSSLVTNSISDSLLNYLWHSTNDFSRGNMELIYSQNEKRFDSIIKLAESFRILRRNKIESASGKLTDKELELLYYQNDARIYQFLFWFGRTKEALSPQDSFFDFVKNIPKPVPALKTSPYLYLYTFEIEYLRENNSLKSVGDFLEYIEAGTEDKDLEDFLKAEYIYAILEKPSYWQKHEKLFNREILATVLEKESDNKYYELFETAHASFLSSQSQSGVEAYNFTAERRDGSVFHLSDLKGKVVYIDTWATWCLACLQERPRVLELAKKYDENPDVEILTISVDSDKKRWKNFFKRSKANSGYELFIENGLNKNFGEKYRIKVLPTYILIDKGGKIVSSNVGEPSLTVENLIEKELNKEYVLVQNQN